MKSLGYYTRVSKGTKLGNMASAALLNPLAGLHKMVSSGLFWRVNNTACGKKKARGGRRNSAPNIIRLIAIIKFSLTRLNYYNITNSLKLIYIYIYIGGSKSLYT
jgi:hypothetical protein